MTTWVTSDQHFGHANIIEYCKRPFSSVEEMDEALIQNFNARVSATDTTIHLGDFSMQEKNVARHLRRLNGNHILIPGNHDACHPAKKRKMVAPRVYESYGFSEIWPLVNRFKIGKHDILLSHMPYFTTEDTEAYHQRYPEFRPTGELPLLCGHVHDAWKTRGKTLNVGVDVWEYAPISVEEIEKALDEILKPT